MSYQRTDRISEEIRKEISSIIMNDLKDPRLSAMTTVVKTEVTRDLRYAKVYVSILGTDKEKDSSMTALKSAAGYIRKELGNRLTIRYIPEVQFVLDSSIEYSIQINKILKDIKADQEDH